MPVIFSMKENSTDSLCLNFFHLLAQKPNLEKNYIYSNKFFHNFHLSESSFTCPGIRASGFSTMTDQPKYDGLLIEDKIYVYGD